MWLLLLGWPCVRAGVRAQGVGLPSRSSRLLQNLRHARRQRGHCQAERFGCGTPPPTWAPESASGSLCELPADRGRSAVLSRRDQRGP